MLGTTVDSDHFVAWARQEAKPLSIPRTDENYSDLTFLREVIGDVRIVLQGENAHYLHEWNRFRARLFKYLVEAHGFNTFVLESGLVEGRNIYDYVAGSDIDWDTVVNSVTNGWGVWTEVQELIQWMRNYNLNPDRDRDLRFYGMDGTANWFHLQHVYDAVAKFTRKVDIDLFTDMERTFEKPVSYINFDRRGEVDETMWHRLVATSLIVVNRIEQNRLGYTESSSKNDYDWGLRSAEIFRDVLLMLSQTELDFNKGFKSFWNIRDVSMASSIEWILKREGPDARILLGAHNTHIQRYPVRIEKATSMGSYIASRIGQEKLLYIGTASAYSVKGEDPLPETNSAAYNQVGPDCYFLDFRKAPSSGPVAKWLKSERMSRHNLRYGPEAPGLAWDCLLFHRRVSIAEVSLAPSMMREIARRDSSRFDDYVGTYVVVGFLAQPSNLTIMRRGHKLYSSGRQDMSGELFPSFQTEIYETKDGRFVWSDWPAVLEFHQNEGPTELVTITMPGMGVYHGKRVRFPD